MNVPQRPRFRHQNGPGIPEVLVVDDLAANRLYLGGLLAKLGIACRYASDGTEAITLSLAFRFSAIFMDLEMREMDGDIAARWLTKLGRRTASVPIIAVTSLHPTEARLRCLRSGIALSLTKPVSRDEIEDVLRRYAAPLLASVPSRLASRPTRVAAEIPDDER